MKANGSIRKFGQFGPRQCAALREKLGLSLPTDTLLALVPHYRQQKRDPSIEELRLIDRIARRGREISHRRALIHELHTNDSAAAETYADLMKKRHVLRPEARAPLTLSEAAGIANAYLARTGKRQELPTLTVLPDELLQREATAMAKTTVGVEGSLHTLQILPRNPLNGGPVPGDVFLLFFKEELESEREHLSKVARLLSSPAFTSRLKRISTVGGEGLLSELLRHTEGCWIDLSRFTLTGVAAPITVLTERYEDRHLALVSRDAHHDLIEQAKLFGVRAAAIATVTEDTRVTVTGGETRQLQIESYLLRSVSCLKAVAKLPNESGAATAPILRRPLSVDRCAYLAEAAPLCDTVRVGEALVATAATAPTEQFFRSALYATLAPVLTLAAAGADHTTQRLSLALNLPQTLGREESLGEAVATLLGIYRAQAELGIPATTYRIRSNRPTEHPALTVFSVAAKTEQTPEHWTTEGGRIFCFAPAITPEGMPDFAALRRALVQLSELSRRGAILSHRVLCNESVTQGLEAMNSPTLRARVTNPTIAAEGALPIAILVEAYSTAEGWTRVGDVVRGEPLLPIPTPAPTVPTLSPIVSRIWSDKREILLLSREGDLHAEMLASLLCEKGARVSLFVPGEENVGRISRALLGSHALILTPGASLPTTQEIRFAAETMLTAGGRILCIGNATAPEELSPVLFPHGIPEDCLDLLAAVEG